MKKSDSGFTIVELLIVIVVIAILATITIVAYNGIQTRARESEISSALSHAKKKLELYKVDNSSYPATNELSSAGITNSGGVVYAYSSSGSDYCLTATSESVSYKVTNLLKPNIGVCGGHTVNGTSYITNLMPNPSAESDVTGWSLWTGNTASTTSRMTSGGFSGTSFYRRTWSSPTGGYVALAAGSVPITPGKTYTASGYIRPSWATSARAGIFWLNSSGSEIANYQGGYTPASVGGWSRYTVSHTAPANAVSGQFRISFNSYPGSNDTIDGDAFMFTEGSSPYNYADGNSSGWNWDGATNNSTSSGPAL